MKLSLSVRIAEAACKTKLHLPFAELVSIAAEAGYDAICMRASAGGTQTPASELARMQDVVRASGLAVSMVTADFDVPLNNDRGPLGLREIAPSLEVAQAFDCDLIRVCLKSREDIPYARQAADQAAERGIRLAHQCHTASLFEEIDPLLDVLASIDRSNFGLIYEPANLMLCGQPYDVQTLRRLQPFLMNVYLQNHRLDPEGPECLETYCRGDVRFHHLPLWETGGVEMESVFFGLRSIGYQGYITVHQAQGIRTSGDAQAFAQRCVQRIRNFVASS